MLLSDPRPSSLLQRHRSCKTPGKVDFNARRYNPHRVIARPGHQQQRHRLPATSATAAAAPKVSSCDTCDLIWLISWTHNTQQAFLSCLASFCHTFLQLARLDLLSSARSTSGALHVLDALAGKAEADSREAAAAQADTKLQL